MTTSTNAQDLLDSTRVIQKNEAAPYTGLMMTEENFRYLRAAVKKSSAFEQALQDCHFECVRELDKSDSWVFPFGLGVLIGAAGTGMIFYLIKR